MIALAPLLVAAGLSVLELDERTFDAALRAESVALVAFTAPWCAHCRALAPTFEALAGEFDGGIMFGRVSSDGGRELLDRFDIGSYPTLLLFDAREVYPYYASEAKPQRYAGRHDLDSLADFVARRGGAERRRAPPRRAEAAEPAAEGSGAAADAAAEALGHTCAESSARYRSCMAHRRDRQHMCSGERHDYLICMSGRWAVPPDKHSELAAAYARFADGEGGA